uniref:Uncharacterized protein n=1 Tax=Oryza nivara TaxID=4536 RepID=A0A0E0I5A3_ORYNI
MGWMRGLYGEMEPYVSKNPRGGAAAIAAVTGSLAVCRSWRGGIWLQGQSCNSSDDEKLRIRAVHCLEIRSDGQEAPTVAPGNIPTVDASSHG